MRVRFWGTRGSIAKAGPSTLKYGGNTSCIEVRTKKGTIAVIDCGTGAHGLGQHLMTDPGYPVRGHLLISHTHWDHIQGVPFFAPLFVPGNHWDIYAPRGLGSSLQETLAGQMQYTYFPVALESLGATIKYHDLVEGQLVLDDIVVHTRYLNHPALTLGYRLEADGAAIVYSCDHEPHSRSMARGEGEPGDQDALHIDFLREASLVIHDAQYTEAEYDNKIGWGHSTVAYAIEMCRRAGAERLALTHHDPLRDDAAVDGLVQDAQQRVSAKKIPLSVFGAAEGLTIELPAREFAKPASPSDLAENASVAPAEYVNALLIVGPRTARTEKIAEAARAEGLLVTQVEQVVAATAQVLSSPFSLIAVDVPSPDLINLSRNLRATLETTAGNAATPLIAVAKTEEAAEGRKAGLADWLLEPFTAEYARTRIRAWVMRRACHWQPAPLPPNDEQRLAALGKLKVLDSAPEDRFDRLTRIAAATFKVPIALVSLVDRERQWFKSAVGLSARETPRDQAFCGHAILSPEILQVADALLDPRFAENPLVVGAPRVRFYAGCPIRTPDGFPVGTMCILDTRPRQLTDSEMGILRDLARLAEAELGS